MSEVTFTQLTSAQIENYCNGTEPFDKAGAYAIQGVGATFISHISGSYSNIMGLPLFETYTLLTEAGWQGSQFVQPVAGENENLDRVVM